MKRILLSLLLICLALLVFASCKNANPNTGETSGVDTTTPVTSTPTSSNETQKNDPPKKEPDDNSPFKIPSDDMRDWVVDYVSEMANVKWTPFNDIDTTDINKGLVYDKGKYYYGIPYTNALTNADLEDFTSSMEWNQSKELYENKTSTNSSNIIGMNSSTPILLSWKHFDTGIKAYDIATCFPLGEGTGIYSVGNLKSGNETNTSAIISATGDKDYYEALALLEQGDMIIAQGNESHARMVVYAEIVRKSDGTVDPDESYVITIEQKDSFDMMRTDNVITTWWMNFTFTFTELKETNYIPVTCKALSEEREKPVVEVNGADTQTSILTSKTLLGTIKSNYSILKVEMFIKDSTGKVVYTNKHKVYSKDMNGETFDISKIKYDFDISTLKSGKYSYSIEVETVCGKGEIYKIEFTK